MNILKKIKHCNTLAGKQKISSKDAADEMKSQYGFQGDRRESYGYSASMDFFSSDETVDTLEDPREAALPEPIDLKNKNQNIPSDQPVQPAPKPDPLGAEVNSSPPPAPVAEIPAREEIKEAHEEENAVPEVVVPKAETKESLPEDKDLSESKDTMGGDGSSSENPKGEVEDLQTDTSDSNAFVKSLTNTSPTSFVKGMINSGNDIAKARENENAELKQSLPEVLQPTGLPVKEEEKEGEAKDIDNIKAPPAIEVKGKEEGKKIQEEHKQSPGTVINVPSPKPQEGKLLSEEMLKSIHKLPVSDKGVNTSAGPRPPLDISGKADPQQNEQNEQLADQEVSDLKMQSDLESKKDFGENDVFPDIKQEILKPGAELSPPVEYSGKDPLELPEMDQETIAAFDMEAKASFEEQAASEMSKADAEKIKMEEDSQKERDENEKKIKEETENTEKEQKSQQLKAKTEVKLQRESWQKENTELQKEFKTESESKKKETQGKIDTEVKDTELKVDVELTQAETKASAEKSKTDQEAARKKTEAENKPKSFWDKVTDAVSSFFDKLKAALNTLFDKLRAFVKSVIEAAKKLVNKLIDMARNAIIGLIKAFGELLKKLVNVLLAKFPALRKKINDLIDKAVNIACEVVNQLADALKKAVNFLLDALGKVLDMILAAYQAFYNLILDALAFIAVGLIKIMKGIANLVLSAKESPGNFWGQMSEEMLGTDVTKPLPNERPAVDDSNVEQAAKTQVEEGNIEQQDANLLAKKKYSPDDIKVDPVADDLQLDPELMAQLSKMGEGGSMEFGQQNEQENDMEALKQDLLQPEEEKSPSSKDTSAEQTPDANDGMVGPFKSAMERAGHLMSQMKKGITDWWNKNKVTIIAALVLGILGVVLANVLTGGAIMAALPLIMQLMSVYFLADTIFNVGKHFGAYLGAAWPGQLAQGAISLARAMAIGAFELVTSLLFGAKGAIKGAKNAAKTVAKQGVKGAMKQGVKTAKNSVKAGVKETFENSKKLFSTAKDGGKNILKNGKIMYKGVSNGFAKGSKTLDDLGKRLGQRLKFKKFKIVIKKFRFSLFGEINPWVLLASGEVKKVKKSEVGDASIKSKVTVDGQDAVYIGKHKPNISSAKAKEFLDSGFNIDQISELITLNKGLEIAEILSKSKGFNSDDILQLIQRSTKHGLEDQIFKLVKSGKLQNPDKLKKMLKELDDEIPKLGNKHELNIASEIADKKKRVEFDTQGDVVDLDDMVVFQAKKVNSESPDGIIVNLKDADKQLAHKGASGQPKVKGDEEPLHGFIRASNIEIGNSKNPLFNASEKEMKKFLNQSIKDPSFSWQVSPLGGLATQKIFIKNNRGTFEFTIHPKTGLII